MTRVNLPIVVIGLMSVLSLGCSGSKMGGSDSQITTDIQSKLYSDPNTRQSGVTVAVKDGAVTLGGEVPNSDTELAAMKIANATTGVHSVADQMKVNSASTATQAPVAGQSLTETGALSSAASSSPGMKAPPQVAQRARNNTLSSPYPATTAPPEATAPAPMPTATPASDRTAPTGNDTERQAEPVRRAEPEQVTIAAGDRLSVRTIDAIDSGKVSEGQALRASLESPLVSAGRVVVPAGAPVTLQITSVAGAGRIRGSSELSLQATSLEYRGRNYPIRTTAVEEAGRARGKNTAIKTGIGAGLGALIGGLAGGGKGAAIGAGAGGGAGFGINALTHGQQVKIPSETVLAFRLESSVVLPAPRSDR